MSAQERLNRYLIEVIRRRRQQRGWTIAELAARSGIPLGSHSALETGRYRLNLFNLFRLQIALQLPITELWPAVGPEVRRPTEAALLKILDEAEASLPPRLTVEDIIRAACDEIGVTPEQVTGPSRERVYSRARCLAFAVVREQPHITANRLSQVFNRHYGTLYHNLELAFEDPEFWRQLKRLERRLNLSS